MTARAGRSTSATSSPTRWPASSGAARRSSPAAGSSPFALDAAPDPLPLDRLAAARQLALPSLRRGRLPARVPPDRPALHGPARLHVRTGAGRGRGRGAPPVAGTGRRHAAALARARRGAVLRDLLLRLGHPLLSGECAE